MAAQSHASKKNLQTGARIALFGVTINIFLAAAKILAGLFGHAYVLIADGIESSLDVGGSIVIWGGLTVAARPPDATHPSGHGKAEPIAALVVAVGVLAAALGLAIEIAVFVVYPRHQIHPDQSFSARVGDLLRRRRRRGFHLGPGLRGHPAGGNQQHC